MNLTAVRVPNKAGFLIKRVEFLFLRFFFKEIKQGLFFLHNSN
jgi:hypothetical protein